VVAAAKKRRQVIGIGNAFVEFDLLPLQLMSHRRVFGKDFQPAEGSGLDESSHISPFACTMPRSSQRHEGRSSERGGGLPIQKVIGKYG